MFLEIPKQTDFEDDERIMEVSFSKLKLEGKGDKKKNSYLVIPRAIPRVYKFNKSDTVVDIKKKLYQTMKEAWKHDEDDEITDEYINSIMYINLRNNSPIKEASKYSITREKCEFCGDSHTGSKELCEISCKDYPNGN
jgi:hypothetical protein